MKLKPMADNVLLKQTEAEETTSSGIILATTNKEKPAIYEVVSAGPGTMDVTMVVKPGDKVVARSSWTARTTSSSSRMTSWLLSPTKEEVSWQR